MRMMDELKPLFLYSSNKKVYAPIDEKNRRKNSAILLLTPNMEVSSKLMKLPYIYNPNLFISFYIDRNVMAYIDNVGIENVDFDEQEEETISESLLGLLKNNVKIKFEEDISILDKNLISNVYNKNNISHYANILKISIPNNINVKIYPNLELLRNSIPKNIKKLYKNKFSYNENNTIHVLSKFNYDTKTVGCPYETYLTTELICNLITNYNTALYFIAVRSISLVLSGQYKWISNNKDKIINFPEEYEFAKLINTIIINYGYNPIIDYIKTGDFSIFLKYAGKETAKNIEKLIFESELSYTDRQKLLPSEFGIPEKRKYPLNDEDHVRAAIRMFNNCDPDDEKELAEAIIKRMKKFGITDVNVSVANRFKKYYNPNLKKKNESVITESFINSDYSDILHICSNLSDEELKKITFYDTYRDSQFVIKRIIRRINGEPAGFLDAYQFPSKPEIVQIVIAVDNRFRNQHVADSMVKELLSSDISKTHNFNSYYWTAHTDNIASQNLALKNGFEDTHNLDKYGRKIFIKNIKKDNDSIWNETVKSIGCGDNDFTSTDNFFITENMAVFYEDNDPKYSNKLRKYLYKERIRNNKGALELYDKIKNLNPEIRKMYLKLEMYKGLNIFVDLSYYHSIFLEKNAYKLDKAVNFYFDFLNRLINNKEIDSVYKKKTIFIPIDAGVWPVQPNTEIYDYKKNLNPISIIFRLIRTNPAALKKAWGDKDIIFVGSRGYFKIDFNTLELKNLTRIKTNLRKLMSVDEPIVDEYEVDSLDDDKSQQDGNTEEESINRKNIDSSKAMAAKMIDKVENGTSIKVDDVSGISTTYTPDTTISAQHLKLSTMPISTNSNDNIAVVIINPDGPTNFDTASKSVLTDIKDIHIYCMPK